MSSEPKLAVFWGDTRLLLSRHEKKTVLSTAILEDISNGEVLLRDMASGRTIVIASVDEKNLLCSLCESDVLHTQYGKNCPSFAKCAIRGKHRGSNGT